jgi:hypothetical protein
MARCYDDLRLVGVRDEIHGAAHAFEYFAGDHVIGEIAVGADLKSLGKKFSSNAVGYAVGA